MNMLDLLVFQVKVIKVKDFLKSILHHFYNSITATPVPSTYMFYLKEWEFTRCKQFLLNYIMTI